MADPPSSSSSECGDLQFSNVFDDEEPVCPDMLQNSSSSSDAEVDPKSFYNILKPFHVPRADSTSFDYADVALKSSFHSQESDFSILNKDDQSTEFVGEQRAGAETGDKSLMEETGVQPILTIDVNTQGIKEEANQGTVEKDQNVEPAIDKGTGNNSVFKVVNMRQIILGTEEYGDSNSFLVTKNVRISEESDAKEDTSMLNIGQVVESENRPCEKLEMSDNLVGKVEFREESTDERSHIDTTDQQNSGYVSTDNAANGDYREIQTEIITDSMLQDTKYRDSESDFQTSLSGIERFAIISENEEDDDEFHTPKDQMSDVEENEDDKNYKDEFEAAQIQSEKNIIKDIYLEEQEFNTNQCRNNELQGEESGSQHASTPTDLNELDRSFVVVGKGTFNQSKHGYRSILSSESENEILKSNGGLSMDKEKNEEVGNIDNRHYGDVDKKQRDNSWNDGEQENLTELNLKTDLDNSELASLRDGRDIREKDTLNDDRTDDRPPVPPKSDAVLESLRSLAEESTYGHETEKDTLNNNATDDPPPVPPKSDAVLESLRSLNEESAYGHEANQRISKTESRNSLTEHNDGHIEESTTQGPSFMAHSQSEPAFVSQQWGYYPPIYYPYIYQQMYQQQMFARQSASMSHSADFGRQNQEELHRSAYGPEPWSLPAEREQQTEAESSRIQVEAVHSYETQTAGLSQQSKETVDSCATLKGEIPISRPDVDTKRAVNKDQLPDSGSDKKETENISDFEKRPRRGPPVPKPRKRLGTSKDTARINAENDQSKSSPQKDTSISQPKKLSPNKDSIQSPSGKSMVAQKAHTIKRSYITPKAASKTGQSPSRGKPEEQKKHERTEEKHMAETLVFVQNVSPNSSTENLQNFLEGGCGSEAEVNETATIYSLDRTQALVTFNGNPDFAKLNKRCSQKTLEGNSLKICVVPDPTCIAVSSDNDIRSTETLRLYFELPKNGGGDLATDEVHESSDGSCKIIQFKSAEVVKRLCSGKYHHVVAGVSLKVSPYYKCDLGEIWDTSLHYIKFPEPKIHPSQKNQTHQKAHPKKRKHITPKARSKTGQSPSLENPEEQKELEKTEDKPMSETLVFVQNVSPNSSTENLQNFLESGCGSEAEVKEDATIYSRDRTRALVTFSGNPVFAELNKRCNQKTLDGNSLKICKVPDPTCIAVSSDDDIQSIEAVMLYFELPKNGGGDLATEEVQESSDGSCKIIQFKSAEVVKQLCSGKYHHKVAGISLKVSPYYKCNLGEIWDTSLHYIQLPDSITEPFPRPKLQFLSRQCCKELKEDLRHKNADIEFTDTGLKLKCTLTQQTPNCRGLAKSWTEDVKLALNTFMTKLSDEMVEVKSHVWEGLCVIFDNDEFEKDTLLIEKQEDKCQLYLFGLQAEVEEVCKRIHHIMADIDRNVRRTSKTLCLKSLARVKLLQTMGIFEKIEGNFTDLTIVAETSSVCIHGVPEDIAEAVLSVHEANNDIITEKKSHSFSRTLVDFLNQVEKENKVIQLVRDNLKTKDILTEFEILENELTIFVPSGNLCKEVMDIVLKMINEEEIHLEKESLVLLEEQIWDELNEDLTERLEDTMDISVDKVESVVHIVGLRESVSDAKKLLDGFFEKHTVKTETMPSDQLTHQFTKRYNAKEIDDIQRRLYEYNVFIQLREMDVWLKGTKQGLQLAKQELKKLFNKICEKTHTFKDVGVVEAMNNIQMQIHDIETRTRCLIQSPFMSETVHSAYDFNQHEENEGATWRELDDEDDEERSSSSVDEPPGFKAKNGIKITLVKGEIGKQEGNVIVCTTSPNLKLDSGGAGKSLLRDGGHSIQDECNEIIAEKKHIKSGEMVEIGGGNLECKHIYLAVLPKWEDHKSLQVLEDIIHECLQKASNDNSNSILFCALGTGGLKYPAEKVATVMYSKVIEFDSASPATTLKEVKFVLHQKDRDTIQAFEDEERSRRFGRKNITYDMKFQNTNVALVVEQLALQKVDGILCTTNKEMNLKASGACSALLAAGGHSLLDECKTNFKNNLHEGQVVGISGGKLKCKSVFLTVLPSYAEGAEEALKQVIQTTLGLAQGKNFKSIACIALGTGYLKYPQNIVAKCMYAAVEEFVTKNSTTCIQQVKFVMHAKDRNTIEAFRSYVRKQKGVTRRKDRTLEDVGIRKTFGRSLSFNVVPDGCKIRHMELKVLTGDILEQDTDGIVNSVSGDFKFVGGVAGALRNRCPNLEKESQRKAKKMQLKRITTTERSKHGGDLKARVLIHVAFQKSLDEWRSILQKCLEKGEKKKLRSLSIPVLGTGSEQQRFKPEEITGCLFDAISNFSAARQHTWLREIRLVVFHKQKFMMTHIMECLHKKLQGAVIVTQEKSSSITSRIKGYAEKVYGSLRDRMQAKKDIPSQKEEVSYIRLKIYSDSDENIDFCIKEIDKALEQEYTSFTLSGYKNLIKSLTKEEMTTLENIECIVNTNIDKNAGIIIIKGPKRFVLDAQTLFYKQLQKFECRRQQEEEAETLYQLIQWHFQEVTNEGIALTPYDKMTNLKIENAYKQKQSSIELFDNVEGKVYVVNFSSLEEYDKHNKEDSTVVVRKDILKAAKQPLPKDWKTMQDDENIRIVNLLSSDPKYQEIQTRFDKEVSTGSFNNRLSSMKNAKITKIDRIQNKTLYWQYMAKKELMMKQTPNPQPQFPIERTVWHGTDQVAVSSIQMHGFNRSYAGDKNGEPWYGYGVYFAACASYSARGWLSGASPAGGGTTKGYIFLVKALTGEFCKGQKGMRFLPPKDPKNSTILYDCAVDDETNPMEFVIFHDAQAYPEYLITFVS